ncbi:uncharacterized protein MKZ38_008830 [Zalerion maritima]|uniref:Translation machinery-associated protein 16 n=1 Tax=Zalerion maritima TaxID=339359 RepID=A0AAD5RTW6_9PEZI|nr:uncharacterized protein MKZ38_008830 [Zalerion maritima]
MAGTLSKTRKQISKKRNGNMDSLHQNSRNTKRLHRALIRDEKLDKIASSRKKSEQPRLERAAFFQQVVRDHNLQPFDLVGVQDKIEEFVHRYDEEYGSLKKARRQGRPPSVREDLLKLKVTDLKQEYEKGFFMPDLMSEEHVKQLDRFEGSWAYLSSLSWVKVSADGSVKQATWSQDK